MEGIRISKHLPTVIRKGERAKSKMSKGEVLFARVALDGVRDAIKKVLNADCASWQVESVRSQLTVVLSLVKIFVSTVERKEGVQSLLLTDIDNLQKIVDGSPIDGGLKKAIDEALAEATEELKMIINESFIDGRRTKSNS